MLTIAVEDVYAELGCVHHPSNCGQYSFRDIETRRKLTCPDCNEHFVVLKEELNVYNLDIPYYTEDIYSLWKCEECGGTTELSFYDLTQLQHPMIPECTCGKEMRLEDEIIL